MRILFIILALFSISSEAFTQRMEKIDSLETLLVNSENDINRFHLLNNLWMESINYNIEASDKYANDMIVLGEFLKIDSIVRFGYERKGVGFAYRNMFDSSGIYFQKALKMYEAIGDEKGAAGLLRNMGQDHHVMGDLDSAYYYYNLSGQGFELANDSSGMASIFNSKAILYLNKGYFNLGLEEALKSDRILLKINESPELQQNYMVIATAYSEMKDTVNALKYYNLINEFFREEGLKRQLCSTLIQSAELQIPDIELKSKTENEIQEAIDIATSLQSKEMENSAQQVYAKFFYQYGDFKKAKTIQLKLANSGKESNSELFIDLAKTFISLGEYDKAIKYLHDAHTIANNEGILQYRALSNKWLSLAYEKKKENGLALQHFKEYQMLDDSIYNTESKNRFIELQTIYETEKKEAKLAIQQREIETLNIQAENDKLTKTIYGIGMFSFLSIAALLYFGFTQRIKKNKIEREKQEEIYMQEIAFKKKELASQTLHLVQKSTFIQELKENLEKIKQSPELFKMEFRRLVMLLKKESAEDREWEVFKSYFSEVHNDFDQSLKASYPDITEKEIRLASFIRMNLNTKEIASILHVLPDSVLKSKYRLKKKLNLDKDQDLNMFLNSL